MMRKGPTDIERIENLLFQLDGKLNLVLTDLKQEVLHISHRLSDVEASVGNVKAAGWEKLEDIDSRVRIMELNVRLIRRTLYRDKG